MLLFQIPCVETLPVDYDVLLVLPNLPDSSGYAMRLQEQIILQTVPISQ